ncbi:thioredoxin domain-containing protein [Tessaracoccus sp. OH4464_COT-324]|uniref:thioredoxin domain-containing protein n=1 Tax=Tessaracoccus sp. OH4464_COT-324 TaxID=2491059 RepID=UPI000F635CBE|nr:thioredoxin domain-containing protein [Tessaracoccus sp. OH4464_COT-324]RRD46476.1 thioredoxin domain-containing protein [Tessaracoccus sp. OH4464_COT-324]
MVNRLAESASDYLRMHSTQPVDWWEWGAPAFAEAARLDVPVLLSIGYASCHWCHVMNDESFADREIAQLINHNFVAIKVDRQQLPDVDAVFITATQAMNQGAAGWPMTLFLTPEGIPFFSGTYFPVEGGPGLPSFRQVLEVIAEGWRERREQFTATGEYVSRHLAELVPEVADAAPEPREMIEKVEGKFDVAHGGFGGAPKFPAPTLIDALLVKGDRQSLELAQRSLEAMARGGIHDQVGGGFHRYSVDAGWVVPHFEKMLYDNALLLGSYVRGWRRTADHDSGLRALLERTAYGIVEWLQREMTSEEGAFHSGLDADSTDIRGSVHEGIFYLWNHELLADALGEEDGRWASEVFHVTTQGTFEHGLSTLQLRGRPDFERLQRVCDALLAERANRFRPGTDRLVVAAWNGWMISSLVSGALIFNEPGWLELALGAGRYLERVHVVDDVLARSSYAGQAAQHEGGAEDYGAVAEAFAHLASATGEAGWLRLAERLLERALQQFGHDDGGFYDAAETGLFMRPRSLTDSVTPSGTSTMVSALRLVGLLAQRPEFVERADLAARTTWATLADFPHFAGSALADLLVADEARRGLKPAVAVVVSDDPFDELARAAWRLAPPGSVVLRASAGAEGWGSHLEGRAERAVHVCRGTVCFDPVSDYTQLKTPLWSRV